MILFSLLARGRRQESISRTYMCRIATYSWDTKKDPKGDKIVHKTFLRYKFYIFVSDSIFFVFPRSTRNERQAGPIRPRKKETEEKGKGERKKSNFCYFRSTRKFSIYFIPLVVSSLPHNECRWCRRCVYGCTHKTIGITEAEENNYGTSWRREREWDVRLPPLIGSAVGWRDCWYDEKLFSFIRYHINLLQSSGVRMAKWRSKKCC